MKKVNKDPFSNGTEAFMFESRCCDQCIKHSYYDQKHDRYTYSDKKNMPYCSIQRDIITRSVYNVPINQRTIDICNDFIMHGKLCPYMKTERKKYHKKNKNQASLDL